jgi:hypothetical protein
MSLMESESASCIESRWEPFKLDTRLVRCRVAAATPGFLVVQSAHSYPAASSKATTMQASPRLIDLQVFKTELDFLEEI